MRVVTNPQKYLGEVDISKIEFNLKSRDDIPRVLKGLQYVYTNEALRREVFALLEEQIAPEVSKQDGRPGMALWKVLVLGVIRLDLNIDYDRLLELSNEHKTLREMLFHGPFNEERYVMQTLKDNVRLLTPELLDNINQVIVRYGHELVKKKDDEVLRGRSDSFVVETNVHFPTDISLLYDAMRKVIELTARLCETYKISDWRQYGYNVRQLKRLLRAIQSKKRHKAKSDEQKKANAEAVIEKYQDYLKAAQQSLDKAVATLTTLNQGGQLTLMDLAITCHIEGFMEHARRQIDQIRRRVIEGEKIPHEEKCFSIFESHTEWISKGKAGVPVELGLRVVVVEDQYRFVLHHQVMQQQVDNQVVEELVRETQKRFPAFNACSFDKGFHSPENQAILKELLAQVTLPRKGKLSKAAKAEEASEDFIRAKRAHSGVESAINALEVHGLDVCPDKGLNGFKRYVALAIVARNIHRIGDILWQREQKRQQKKRRREEQRLLYSKAA